MKIRMFLKWWLLFLIPAIILATAITAFLYKLDPMMAWTLGILLALVVGFGGGSIGAFMYINERNRRKHESEE